nr:disaggregatase related repeat-containing protein [uncultured Methanomethylovorans sp.]
MGSTVCNLEFRGIRQGETGSIRTVLIRVTPYTSVTFPASVVPDNRYYEFDVTELVQEYVSGTNNTGFFLKARTEGGNYIAFYSSEWPNADQRPKLTITHVN